MSESITQKRMHCDLEHFDRYIDCTSKSDTLPILLSRRIKWIAQYTEDLKILDLGCGPGHWTWALLERIGNDSTCNHLKSIHYTGIDNQEKAVEELKIKLEAFGKTPFPKNPDIEFFPKVDLYDWNSGLTGGIKEPAELISERYRNRKFDLILCSHALYYVGTKPVHWKNFVKTVVSKLLTPNGEFCAILTANEKLIEDIHKKHEDIIQAENIGQSGGQALLKKLETLPMSNDFRKWLESKECPLSFKYDLHESILTKSDLLSVAQAYSFLVGIDIAGDLNKDVRKRFQLVAESIYIRPLVECIYWVRKHTKDAIDKVKVRAFHIDADIQRCTQQTDYSNEEYQTALSLDFKESEAHPVPLRVIQQYKSRSSLIHKYLNKDEKCFSPLEQMFAYYTCDPIRLELSEQFGYLAGAVIGWKGEKLVIPATDPSLGTEVVRQPILPVEGLKGLHRSFKILLCNNGNNKQKQINSLQHSKIKQYFPTVTMNTLKGCITAELRSAGRVNYVQEIIECFCKWIKSEHGMLEDVVFIPKYLSIKMPEESLATSGFRIFWQLALGVFLRLLERCGNQIELPSPYKHDEAINWKSEFSANYIPHVKVLSVYIDMLLILAHVVEQDLEVFKRDCFIILNNIGALTGDNFTNSLALNNLPKGLEKTEEQKLWCELAGKPFNYLFEKTDGQFKKPKLITDWKPEDEDSTSLEKLSKVAGFSPQNIYPYLYSDTVSTQVWSKLYREIKCRTSLMRRGILWYKTHSSIASQKHNDRIIMCFATNIDESVCFQHSRQLATQFATRILAIKNIFAEVASQINSLYDASELGAKLEKKGLKEGVHEFFHTVKSKLGSIESFIFKLANGSDVPLSKRQLNGKSMLKLLQHQVDVIYKLETGKDINVNEIESDSLKLYHSKSFNSSWEVISAIIDKDVSLTTVFEIPQEYSAYISYDLFDILLYEVLWNLKQHAIFSHDITVCYRLCDTLPTLGTIKEQLCLIIENTADDNAIEDIIDGTLLNERGNPRLRGLGLIERLQKYLHCPYWDVEMVSEEKCKVRFYFPFEMREKK